MAEVRWLKDDFTWSKIILMPSMLYSDACYGGKGISPMGV